MYCMYFIDLGKLGCGTSQFTNKHNMQVVVDKAQSCMSLQNKENGLSEHYTSGVSCPSTNKSGSKSGKW